LDAYPVIFIGTKADGEKVKQDCFVQPEEYCQQLNLAPPLQLSRRDGDLTEAYTIMIGVAMTPYVCNLENKKNALVYMLLFTFAGTLRFPYHSRMVHEAWYVVRSGHHLLSV
jgi:hypothetical protein